MIFEYSLHNRYNHPQLPWNVTAIGCTLYTSAFKSEKKAIYVQ